MSDILLVEDDEYKRSRITDFIEARFPSATLRSAASLMSGVRALKAKRPDVVILDMTLPNFDLAAGETGGGMHAFGGIEFLKQVHRFQVDTKVIVLTQFETFGQPSEARDLAELDREMLEQFPRFYVGAVYYHASLEDWANRLEVLLMSVLGDSE